MVGEVIGGRYRVTKQLGKGGMGEVYAALDTHLSRRVAIKVIKPELANSPEMRQRFKREAIAASQLGHPGVATVFEFADQGAKSFIVYEYVEGLTLRAMLGRHRFSALEVLEIGVQLAEALVPAQEQGVVHRDLKPENIMVVGGDGQRQRVKILDFGLAKLSSPLRSLSNSTTSATNFTGTDTAPGLLVGTVSYMAPEQIEQGTADHRADLYALGLVLYEMATGINPFVGTTATSTIANILKQDPPPVLERNPVAPAGLDHILRKCLRKRPEERYQSARELAVDLSNLQREIEQGKQPQRLPERSDLEVRRSVARSLAALIQLAYLIMYGLAFNGVRKGFSPLGGQFGSGLEYWLMVWVLTAALAGTPVRLYLLSAIGFDYVNTGRLFRQMFPLVLLFDLAWAVAAPFLLYQQLGPLVLLFAPALAYLPFSQRTTVLSAYAAKGGRSSGVGAEIARPGV